MGRVYALSAPEKILSLLWVASRSPKDWQLIW